MKLHGIILSAAAAGFAMFVSHADNLSLTLRTRIAQTEPTRSAGSERIQVFIGIGDGFDPTVLERHDAEIVLQGGNSLSLSIPSGNVAALASERGVLRLDLPSRAYPCVDVTRRLCGVDDVHESTSPDIPDYRGRNVIVGIIDTGIDPFHPAFYDVTGTKHRVSLYARTKSAEESESGTTEVVIARTAGEMKSLGPDTAADGHGTHVASTAAGSSYLCGIYSGMAPEADIALVSTGELIYDDEMIKALEVLLDYAEEKGLPMVVNLSIGNTLGPHDGTGSVQAAIDAASAKGVIPVFSAGNDGNSPVSLKIDFSKSREPVSTVLFNAKSAKTPPANFYAQAWSRDDKEFKCRLSIIDFNSREVVAETPDICSGITDDGIIIICGDGAEGEPLMPEWSEFFPGTVAIESGVDKRNGRFYMQVSGETGESAENLKYLFGLTILPSEASLVNIYSDSSSTHLARFSVPGFTAGNSSESISDFCTSPGPISVGMWNGRDEWTDIAGNEHRLTAYLGNLNELNNHSSYGSVAGESETLLPHIVAPGCPVMAALNPSVKFHDGRIIMSKELDGVTYNWGSSVGTSMSSPVVSGIIALWLEADPGLDRDDILDIMKHSSTVNPEFDSKPNYYGFGNIDAYNGIKYILSKTTIGAIGTDNDRLLLKQTGKRKYECAVPSFEGHMRAYVYDSAGSLKSTRGIPGPAFSLDLADLAPGVYILSVCGERFRVHCKIILN